MISIKTKTKQSILKVLQAYGRTADNILTFFRRYGYEKCASGKHATVLGPKKGSKPIIAILDNTIVTGSLYKNPKEIYLYPDFRFKSIKYNISLNEHVFPGLIKDSCIENVLLLRYMRRVSPDLRIKSWRLVIITDKGQLYHNYPSDSKDDFEGVENCELIDSFAESVVWDMPGRKFPSSNADCNVYEEYYPGLPQECYEYHPPINGKNGFGAYSYVYKDGKKVLVSRFYFSSRRRSTNPFIHMGGYTNDYFMTTVGTYRSNLGSATRTCVFFSSDGGRQWFNKYEFGDFGEYAYVNTVLKKSITSFGNSINLKHSLQLDGQEIFITKRSINNAFYENKTVEPFVWSNGIRITKINTENGVVLETEIRHQLQSGNIVALYGKTRNYSGFDWMLNNEFFNDSCGCGRLFKIQVLSEKSFRIYEFASSTNAICCRHIHHINRQKDGWLIGTGETYPNGWLLFLQYKESDCFVQGTCDARSEVSVYRLNSREVSVQRTIGAEFIGDFLVYASDDATLPERRISIRDDVLERSSTGIFLGSITDIDDRTEFKCVHETPEVGYFFRKINNYWIFGGQLGDVAIGKSLSDWQVLHLDKTLRCYKGSSNNAINIDGYIFVV